MDFFEQINEYLLADGAFGTIMGGLGVTLRISILALLLGTGLGALVCFGRMCKFKAIRFITGVYIAILRGTPVLMLLLLMYYVILAKTPLESVTIAVITFGLNTSAYVAELLRSALTAADKGQAEAARTLGFSRLSAFCLVTMPQALTIAKPVYQSTIVNLIQWTSVVGYITITDLTRVINNFSARTMQPVFMIVAGMLIYLAVSYIVYGVFAVSDKISLRRRSE